jgi:hypothetical protein
VEWKHKKGITALCQALGISQAFYRMAVAQIERVYIEKPLRDRKSGKLRQLCYPAPDSALGAVQKLIKDRILSQLKLVPQVRGYRPGSHNINTAAAICRHKFMGKVDIRGFHPSITRRHVQWALSEHGLSPSWSREIARLVIYKGSLPQGASTSNHIANLVLDSVLRRHVLMYCSRHSQVPKRYASVWPTQSGFSKNTTSTRMKSAATASIVGMNGSLLVALPDGRRPTCRVPSFAGAVASYAQPCKPSE